MWRGGIVKTDRPLQRPAAIITNPFLERDDALGHGHPWSGHPDGRTDPPFEPPRCHRRQERRTASSPSSRGGRNHVSAYPHPAPRVRTGAQGLIRKGVHSSNNQRLSGPHGPPDEPIMGAARYRTAAHTNRRDGLRQPRECSSAAYFQYRPSTWQWSWDNRHSFPSSADRRCPCQSHEK